LQLSFENLSFQFVDRPVLSHCLAGVIAGGCGWAHPFFRHGQTSASSQGLLRAAKPVVPGSTFHHRRISSAGSVIP
jgi:hypothetical protein